MFSCVCCRPKRKQMKKEQNSTGIKRSNANQTTQDQLFYGKSKFEAFKKFQAGDKSQTIEDPLSKGAKKDSKSGNQTPKYEGAGKLIKLSLPRSSQFPLFSESQSKQPTTTPKNQLKSSVKQQQLHEIQHFNTNNQNLLERYFSFDKKDLNFHTHPNLEVVNKAFSSKLSKSIDYSKYSEQDRQISSTKILEIDEDMQNKLKQYQASNDLQNKLNSQSGSTNQKQTFQKSPFPKSLFPKSNEVCIIDKVSSSEINPAFPAEDLQGLNFKSSLQKSAKYKDKIIKAEFLKQTEIQVPSIESLKDLSPRQKFPNLVQNTVQAQFENMSSDIFFSFQQPLAKPESLENFKKILMPEENDLVEQQSLQEAQNEFYCNSINEQFSRAAIRNKLALAMKIFEKKNSVDVKGYHPLHLCILKAITNEIFFDMAKKLMFHPDTRMDIKGPTGWSPLQDVISYKHIRLTPHAFVISNRNKISLIKQSLQQLSDALLKIKDFEMTLEVKIDSFIPFVGNLTPNDTITITKKGNILLIDYSLVGYEFLSCKRRDMGFLLKDSSIFAINRSRKQFCNLLQEFDKEEIQILAVQSLQTETKKTHPQIKNVEFKQATTILGNMVTDTISQYSAQKYLCCINYTSLTEKRMPEKLFNHQNQDLSLSNCPLKFLSSWEQYLSHDHKVKVKPKNENKKIDLEMWLSEQFHFEFSNLIQIFQLFGLSNPLIKTISKILFSTGVFLNQHFSKLDILKGSFPVKVQIPISFSLYLNLLFKQIKFQNFKKKQLQIENDLQKLTRKEFQNIAESKQKQSFAIIAFT